MSWCRWSSMEFACDLYVYESDTGVEVHVAARRRNVDRSSLPPTDAWLDRHAALMVLMSAVEPAPIDLPHAGEWRTFDDPTAAADWIDELEALGYVVPPGMTDDMREEDPR